MEGRSLPHFITIGAMKAGTTSLHYYLRFHPQIFMSKKKELKFFIKGWNWEKGMEWYKKRFLNNGRVCGESSVHYSAYPHLPGVPERIHSVIPDVKLIYLVRDPIERIRSHYVHEVDRGTENRTFPEALSDLAANPYLDQSKYAMQLEQYLKFFPKERILVVASEDLLARKEWVLQKVFGFLGVDPRMSRYMPEERRHLSSEKRRKLPIANRLEKTWLIRLIQRLPEPYRYDLRDLIYYPFSQRVERPALESELRDRLVQALQADVRQLRTLTGEDFKSWSL